MSHALEPRDPAAADPPIDRGPRHRVRSGGHRAGAAAIVLGATGIALALGARKGDDSAGERCGPGFVARGPRCVALAAAGESACPPPLVATGRGCDAPDVRVLVPAATVTIGPSDWEAEGRVRARSIRVDAFRIDAFEATQGAFLLRAGDAGANTAEDPARAASLMTRSEAAAFCASKGGRLPTEDEWIVAAGASSARRYAWGDTGAVCRRAAWGLEHGPCAVGGAGPDTVGTHPSGDSPLGLHDLAGNVAEWVMSEPPFAPNGGALFARGQVSARPQPERGQPARGQLGQVEPGAENAPAVAKGGSWQSSLASDLRIWARLELPAGARDARVGFRCVYPP